MCGIAGIVETAHGEIDRRVLFTLTETLAHRGPDGRGYVLIDAEDVPGKAAIVYDDPRESAVPRAVVGLGHRRLAVLDPSQRGRQPMLSQSGRCWIVHNGEIYNYLELRTRFPDILPEPRSGTDTETLLELFEALGPAALEHINGMFAFAIWDRRHSRLFLARDRFGIRPLYYVWRRGQFLFASEPKAFLAAGESSEVEPASIAAYAQSGRVNDPTRTFFKSVHSLPPAHYLVLEAGTVEVRRYWEPPPERSSADDSSVVEELEFLVRDSVRIRLRSDVPVVSTLSGGLDSSILYSYASGEMSTESSFSRVAYSCVVGDIGCDEQQYAKAVVSRAGGSLREVAPDPARLFESIDRILWHHDQPFVSASMLAQWSLMEAIGDDGFRVAIGGQGADELFAGYQGAFYAKYLTRSFQWLQLLRYLTRTPGMATRALRRHRAYRGKLAPGFSPDLRRWVSPEPVPKKLRSQREAWVLRTSLPHLLHSEDRNAMAHGVETRAPFLDHRIVELVWNLPDHLFLHRGWTKWTPRQIACEQVPPSVVWRVDKMGFPVPQSTWLRTAGREWLQETLDESILLGFEWFAVAPARKALRRFLAGDDGVGEDLWRVALLARWLRGIHSAAS